jgi:hypothetical protein
MLVFDNFASNDNYISEILWLIHFLLLSNYSKCCVEVDHQTAIENVTS